MDYKEKILADFQEMTATDITVLATFRATNILEQILTTLPSEKEIAKGWWSKYGEYCNELFRQGVPPREHPLFLDWLDTTNSKEEEDGRK